MGVWTQFYSDADASFMTDGVVLDYREIEVINAPGVAWSSCAAFA